MCTPRHIFIYSSPIPPPRIAPKAESRRRASGRPLLANDQWGGESLLPLAKFRHCCFCYCCCPSVSPSTSADVKAPDEFDQQQQSDCQQSDQQQQQQQQQRSSASLNAVFASIRLQNDQWRTSKSLIGSSHVVVHRLRCFLRFLIATLCCARHVDFVGIQLQFRRWAMVIGSRNVSSQYEPLHWNTELFRVPSDAVRVRVKCEALLAAYEFEPREHRLEVQWKRFAEDGDVSAEETDRFERTETAILEVETTAGISSSKLQESIKWRCLARVPLPAGGNAAVAISRPLTFVRSDIGHEEAANDGNALGEKEKTEREEREAEEFVLILHKIQGDSTNLPCNTNRSLAEHPKNVQWWLNGQQMPIGPRTQLKPGSNLSGLQLSLSFLDPSDQGFYDCSVERSDGPLRVERVQHILLIVQRTASARLEQVQIKLEHRPERCFRVNFLQPKGTRMNDAYRQKYFLTFYRLHEPMQKVIRKDVDQGERNMSLPDNDKEESEQYFGDTSLLHQSEQINSHAFRLMPRGCAVVPDPTDGNGTSGEGRVRCEFRCCQADTCGAQFDTGAVKYAFQAAAIIGAGAITALSQPPTIVSTWDDFAPKALPLDFLFNRQSSQLWIRWHVPDPSQIRGLVERYHLEVEFEQNKKRLQRIERRLPAFDTESHLNISGRDSFAVRVRVVPETRSGLPQEELMMASPHQYPYFIFTDWMEQHFPEGTISSDASIPVPVVLFRQPSNGQSSLTVTWDSPSAEQIRWMLIRAIRLRSTEAIGEGIWRLNASDVNIELDHTNFELGFVYQLCATFVSEQPQRAHGPWRCQAVPFFDANGQLKAADELTSEAPSLGLKSVEEDEQYGKSNGVERAAAAHLLLSKSDEDGYEHLPEPIHCQRAHCRCAFIAPTVPSEKMAMTISWEPVDGLSSSSSTGFKMGESRMVAVHYTLDKTDDPTATWMSPFLAVHIPSDAPTRRQIQFEIEDDLQLLPDTTYRFMLEAFQKERRKDLPSLEGTYFDCHIPADLDLPPPTNFRLAPFTTAGKRIDGFELHFQRVDRANILLDGWQVDGEGTTRRQSDFHRTIQGAQADNFLLDEPLSNTYQVWLCTHWTDANLTSPYSSSSSFLPPPPPFCLPVRHVCPFRSSFIRPPLLFHLPLLIPLAAPPPSPPPLSDDHPSPSIQQHLPLYKHPVYWLCVVGLFLLLLLLLLSTAVLWMQQDRSWSWSRIWRQLKRNRRRRGRRDPSKEKGTEMNPFDCPNGSSTAKHIPQHLQNGLHKMLALRSRESDALLEAINAENVEEPNGVLRHLRSVSMHFEHPTGSNACGVGVGPAEGRVVVQVENAVEDEWHRQADTASNSHFTHSLSPLHRLFSPVTMPKTQHRRRVSAPFILLLAQQSHSSAVFKMVNDDSGIAIAQHDDELKGGEEEVSRTSVCTSSDDAAHEEERTVTDARMEGLNCRKRSSVVTDEANSSNDSSSLHFDGELEVKRVGEKPMANYPTSATTRTDITCNTPISSGMGNRTFHYSKSYSNSTDG
uniref:Ig-like domain-containing protein n=1 Tax=Globodera rostochiensis TaxID=31243 RepID=A0A914I753_GLORO